MVSAGLVSKAGSSARLGYPRGLSPVSGDSTSIQAPSQVSPVVPSLWEAHPQQLTQSLTFSLPNKPALARCLYGRPRTVAVKMMLFPGCLESLSQKVSLDGTNSGARSDGENAALA